MSAKSIARHVTPGRWRWGCPRDHVDWIGCDDHIYCRGCQRLQNSGEEIDPRWETILDRRTGEELDFERVEVQDGE